MNIILFDEPTIRQSLVPLTYTRPVAEIRIGILTIAEKWQHYAGAATSYLTQPYLQQKYPKQPGTPAVYINGAVCPDEQLVAQVKQLKQGEGLYHNGMLVALHSGGQQLQSVEELLQFVVTEKQEVENCVVVRQVWEIFQFNGAQIRSDFKLITAGRKSQPLQDRHTMVYGEENIFIEEGVVVRAAVLNAEAGPIYLGKNAQVEEGALIRGPFALCEGSTVNMGGKMRGDTTVGPQSKVGGEIGNSVILGYSNKGHDGYLGNSVLGEWCNLGADTNTSNLKNNYAPVKLWSYARNGFVNTGQQFCGLIMGDHSKSGINTMFNTGTVVGVAANVFGAGFPRNMIPSFAWGGAAGFETFQLNKAYEVAERVMARRKIDLTDTDKAILAEVFEQSKQYRVWENV
ncbi:GlmU family protein [Botryobacter ruber]|uniref:GlmU family protein n=1 Tax=Botryobacter ruber TaxID=2171629 RepID=UPI000E0B8778|nr:GlmU family protein [Botryobacter ruber]